jgi:hypothetical protein
MNAVSLNGIIGQFMAFIVFFLIMAGVVASVASSKGKSAGAWFLYGLLIWPVALAHILLTTADSKSSNNRAIQTGGKKCPQCAEIVKREAIVCRFCGNRDFDGPA